MHLYAFTVTGYSNRIELDKLVTAEAEATDSTGTVRLGQKRTTDLQAKPQILRFSPAGDVLQDLRPHLKLVAVRAELRPAGNFAVVPSLAEWLAAVRPARAQRSASA